MNSTGRAPAVATHCCSDRSSLSCASATPNPIARFIKHVKFHLFQRYIEPDLLRHRLLSGSRGYYAVFRPAGSPRRSCSVHNMPSNVESSGRKANTVAVGLARCFVPLAISRLIALAVTRQPYGAKLVELFMALEPLNRRKPQQRN